ncbi:MAG: LLM class flavin-dependent oxidoreductase [Candidatus Rokubacteria bacterium]|nr:LLM class flavin-dependent oxidoreductase [Candidatus Rokubacteria bacterium]
MKFGVFFLLEQPPWKSQEAVYADALRQAAYAEELGFDAVWLAEHHFSEYGICPSMAVLAGALAQRTQRVSIGTAVTILPFNHPLRIAEEWAMVDLLSGGRVDFGVGRGYQPGEYGGFGIPMSESRERFDEALAIIKQAWTAERVDFEGKHFTVRDVAVLPKPVQKPHPPIRIACVSPDTFERVARRGERFLSAPSITPVALMKAAYETYRTVWLASGHPPAGLEIPALYFTHVGEDAAAIRNDTERSIMWYFDTLARVIAESTDPARVPEAYRFYARAKGNLEAVTYDFLVNEIVLFGEAHQVTERIRFLRDTLGLTYLITWMNFGGLNDEAVCRSMRRFADKVIPSFR